MKTLSLHKPLNVNLSSHQMDMLSGSFAFFKNINTNNINNVNRVSVSTKNCRLDIPTSLPTQIVYTDNVFVPHSISTGLVFVTNSVFVINNFNYSYSYNCVFNSNINVNDLVNPVMDVSNALNTTINNDLHINSFYCPKLFL